MQSRRTLEILAVLILAAAGWSCATVQVPAPSPLPCSRVALDPAPLWTVSAAWDRDEEEMLLVDPKTQTLATYGRDGRRLKDVSLDGVAEIDFASAMRLERTADGYALIGKRQILYLDEELALRRLDHPFKGRLAARGFENGGLNDVVLHGGRLYGFADYVDTNAVPADDPKASGTWRPGFVRIDPQSGKIALLEEFSVERDGEFNRYYVYDHRPYVAELDGKVYVLRFTRPWSVHRATRRGLRQVAVGEPSVPSAEPETVVALYAWNGRLYVLTSRPHEKDAEEASAPELLSTGSATHAQLVRAESLAGKRRWRLHEIDPAHGRAARTVELPSAAERLRLITGRTFWTGIEESAGANLGRDGDGTSFLFLPATEIVAGRFSCPVARDERKREG